MRTTRIYINSSINTGETLTLPVNASNHLVRVLRCRKNSAITLFNGKGGEFSATLLDDNPKSTCVLINSFSDIDRASPLRITLIQCLSRGEHMDLTIQKATELGVSEIIPVLCERSTYIKKERSFKKQQRWNQIAISACEQSGRNLLPGLHAITEFETAVNEAAAGTNLVLDPNAAQSLKNIANNDATVCIISGPEGGFSQQEINLCSAAGYNSISLGPRILRTETAAPAIISALQALWGDMG